MKHNYQIGNWVIYEYCYARISAIHKDYVLLESEGDGWKVSYEEIEPVPITAEILEMNGFVKDFYYYNLDEEDGRCLQYYPLEWGLDRWYKDDILFRCQCYYVHQLQQAFKLCGIDKEIEL